MFLSNVPNVAVQRCPACTRWELRARDAGNPSVTNKLSLNGEINPCRTVTVRLCTGSPSRSATPATAAPKPARSTSSRVRADWA